jgi:hypothetical protein
MNVWVIYHADIRGYSHYIPRLIGRRSFGGISRELIHYYNIATFLSNRLVRRKRERH